MLGTQNQAHHLLLQSFNLISVFLDGCGVAAKRHVDVLHIVAPVKNPPWDLQSRAGKA